MLMVLKTPISMWAMGYILATIESHYTMLLVFGTGLLKKESVLFWKETPALRLTGR